MKFSLAALTSALLAAAPSTLAHSVLPSTAIFKITDFAATKLHAVSSISTVSFRIIATTGGALDLECKAYDTTVGREVRENFRENFVYSCGETSSFSFKYVLGTKQLYLWQNVSDDTILAGSVTVEEDNRQAEYLVAMRNLLQ